MTKLKGWMHLQDAEGKQKHQGISASQDQKYADRDIDGYF